MTTVGIITLIQNQKTNIQITDSFLTLPMAWHEPAILMAWLFKRAYTSGGSTLFCGINFKLISILKNSEVQIWELQVNEQR